MAESQNSASCAETSTVSPAVLEITPKVVELYQSGVSSTSIAEFLGVSKSQVHRALRYAGIRTRKTSDYDTGWHRKATLPLDEIRCRYEAGETISILAKAYGVGFGTMQRHLAEAGAVFRKNSWNRFEDKRQKWIEMYEIGEPLKVIAAQSDVNPATARRYLLESGVKLRADSSVPTHVYVSPCAGTIELRGSWERAYATILDEWFSRGYILDWQYEPDKFDMRHRRAGQSYLPDFRVITHPMTITYHEVKGLCRPKALAKVRAAREAGLHVVLVTGQILKPLCKAFGIKIKI
jgi:transposase